MKLSPRMIELLKDKKEQIISQCKCKAAGCDECSKKFNALLSYAKSGIPIRYWTLKLSDYNLCLSAKEKVVSYIKNLDDNFKHGRGLFLKGDTGLGKTYLACCILKAALRAGYTGRFITLAEAITKLGDGYYDREARDEFQQDIAEVDFLVIDEVDKIVKSNKSDFVEACIDTLFRQRANQLLPVILTGNKDQREITDELEPTYAVSLLSLFDELVVPVVFIGEDYRKKIKKEKQDKVFRKDD